MRRRVQNSYKEPGVSSSNDENQPHQKREAGQTQVGLFDRLVDAKLTERYTTTIELWQGNLPTNRSVSRLCAVRTMLCISA